MPVSLEISKKIPAGIFVYQVTDLQTSPGDPLVFILSPRPNFKLVRYRLLHDLPVIIGLPENNPPEGLCWEYPPGQVVCYQDNQEIPHPRAWWYSPFLFLCHENLVNLSRE